ncbi:MAG TPA: Hpt domain-containing protein, partial [Fibrobacteria bacterium]|nr:Hpt domain-containing protein [Fibrobacteria bacterium]
MDEAFLERLRDIFRAEARDHVSDLREGLRELEANGASGPSAALDKAFRAAHSLKGAARAVNEADVEARGQDLENRLAALKKGRGVEAGSADLHVALEALAASLEEAGISVEVGPPAASQRERPP